jgi:predicted nucleic acid-binding Zn ribbon protein
MTHHRRSPRPLEFALTQLADDLAPQTVLAGVQRAWPTTVGKAIAEEAVPTAERGGVLTVSCSAAVWAQELDLMGPSIVSRLNAELGQERIKRLRCVAL